MSGVAQEWLGDQGNVIPNASGIQIPLNKYGAVTFVSWEDDGSTILTFTQHTKTAAGAADVESNLAAITRYHKGPGVGGTWTEVTQTAANTIDLADDTVNDAIAVTVRADQLSDDNVFVECTTDGVQLMAILHQPDERRAGAQLASSIAY